MPEVSQNRWQLAITGEFQPQPALAEVMPCKQAPSASAILQQHSERSSVSAHDLGLSIAAEIVGTFKAQSGISQALNLQIASVERSLKQKRQLQNGLAGHEDQVVARCAASRLDLKMPQAEDRKRPHRHATAASCLD